MNVEEVREYALAKKEVTEGFPFGEGVLVFKVAGKMFLLMSIDSKPLRVNLKMNVELVEQYREKYSDVLPGYHMNKKMWNSVLFDTGTIPNTELRWMIDHSYAEVVKGLPKKDREALQ